ncbi:MAG: MarC family protein [Alphaproteobacteria bacterium]
MLKSLLYSFTTLFVVIDPVGTAAIFALMTRVVPPGERRRMAFKACALAVIILFLFALGGEALFAVLGIGMPAFRIGGGILLFLLATDMVFARPSGLRGITESEDMEAAVREDLTVFPLAFPLLAGPGAMTTVVLLMGRTEGDPLAGAALLGLVALVMAITLVLFLHAGRLLKILGRTGSNVVTRILGIILAALAVQFVLDGLILAVAALRNSL